MSFRESRNLCMILLTLITLLAFVRAQDNPYKCTSHANYTSNSTYSANLNALLKSLSLNISGNGFYGSFVGQNQDRANGLALCRADQILDQCRSCVQSAVREILQSCPNQRQAVIWYEYCTVRYSNDPIYRTQTSDPGKTLRNIYNVSNPDQFREDRARLLEDLRVRAANGNSALKVGAGTRSTSDSESQTIYGLVQCVPELSPEDCGGCLIEATQRMRNCCDISRGVRMLRPNCNIRYELYPFYNETRLSELGVLQPPASSPPGTDGDTTRRKKDDNTAKVIIIFVPVGVCLIFAACAVIFLRKRMKRRSKEITKTTDEISTVESLQYDSGKIRAATIDFDDVKKLGPAKVDL